MYPETAAQNNRSYGNANMPNSVPPGVKLGIGDHSQELHSAIDGVRKRLDELTQRLAPILTPEGPSTDSAGSSPTPVRSQVVESFVNAKYSVMALGLSIDRLMGRIEL